jgi:hypothetical protein
MVGMAGLVPATPFAALYADLSGMPGMKPGIQHDDHPLFRTVMLARLSHATPLSFLTHWL